MQLIINEFVTFNLKRKSSSSDGNHYICKPELACENHVNQSGKILVYSTNDGLAIRQTLRLDFRAFDSALVQRIYRVRYFLEHIKKKKKVVMLVKITCGVLQRRYQPDRQQI